MPVSSERLTAHRIGLGLRTARSLHLHLLLTRLEKRHELERLAEHLEAPGPAVLVHALHPSLRRQLERLLQLR